MKLEIKKWNDVKSKDSALNQAVAALQALETSQRKESTVMRTMEDLTKKINNLQEKIKELQESKEYLEGNSLKIQERLDFLKREFNLTQAEILERKSELLRKQIAHLQMQAQSSTTGETKMIES